MDYSGPLDAGSLFSEINTVFKKYGVGKGVGFVPDRLEVVMDRATSGACTLIYREFFTYLPPDVMELAMGNAVEFLGASAFRGRGLRSWIEASRSPLRATHGSPTSLCWRCSYRTGVLRGM